MGIGSEAPNLRLTLLDERSVRLHEIEAEYILLDFWATWCGPCVKELHYLREAHKRFKPLGLEIIGIAEDDPDSLRRFLVGRDIHWPQVGIGWGPDADRRPIEAYTVKTRPEAFLINRDHRIVARGYQLRHRNLATTLEKHFALLE